MPRSACRYMGSVQNSMEMKKSVGKCAENCKKVSKKCRRCIYVRELEHRSAVYKGVKGNTIGGLKGKYRLCGKVLRSVCRV